MGIWPPMWGYDSKNEEFAMGFCDVIDDLKPSAMKEDDMQMTPGEWESERVVKGATEGDILRLTPECERETKFAYFSSYEHTTNFNESQGLIFDTKGICVFVRGRFIYPDNYKDGTLVVGTVTRIPINVTKYKVSQSSVEEFVAFHRQQCLDDIAREKRTLREQLRHSKEIIREKKRLLRLLGK